MVRVVREEGQRKHSGRLSTLADEHRQLKEDEKKTKKRLDQIREEILEIGGELGEERERLIMPVESGHAWDRRYSPKGAGLDLELLEANLTRKRYRDLCCNRETVYTFNQAKMDMAQRNGEITDDQLAACMREGEIGYSVQIIPGKDIPDEG